MEKKWVRAKNDPMCIYKMYLVCPGMTEADKCTNGLLIKLLRSNIKYTEERKAAVE